MMGQQHQLASETSFDAIQMAFRWRTNDNPLIVVSGSNISSSFKNKQRKKADIVGPPLTKTVWIRTYRADSSLFLCITCNRYAPQMLLLLSITYPEEQDTQLRRGGGTLIFSYTRRLGPFLGVQKFQFQYVFAFFREMNIFGGMKILLKSLGFIT